MKMYIPSSKSIWVVFRPLYSDIFKQTSVQIIDEDGNNNILIVEYEFFSIYNLVMEKLWHTYKPTKTWQSVVWAKRTMMWEVARSSC